MRVSVGIKGQRSNTMCVKRVMRIQQASTRKRWAKSSYGLRVLSIVSPCLTEGQRVDRTVKVINLSDRLYVPVGSKEVAVISSHNDITGVSV